MCLKVGGKIGTPTRASPKGGKPFGSESHGVVGRIPGGYFIGLTGFAAMKKRGRHIREMLESGDLPLQQLMLEMHVSNITML